jgi:hypothetical protein
MKKEVWIIGIVLVLAIIGFGFFDDVMFSPVKLNKNDLQLPGALKAKSVKESEISRRVPYPIDGCGTERMTCPDGTTVGRVPPYCDFSPCVSVKVATEKNKYLLSENIRLADNSVLLSPSELDLREGAFEIPIVKQEGVGTTQTQEIDFVELIPSDYRSDFEKKDFLEQYQLISDMEEIRKGVEEKGALWEAEFNDVYLETEEYKNSLICSGDIFRDIEVDPYVPSGRTDYPDSFDLRDLHGENYLTQIQDQ